MTLEQPHSDDLTPDPLLREALQAVDRAPSIDLVALRQRVLTAAAPQLAARRAPSWWDVTGRAGRFLIPMGLAAAAVALLLLREPPSPNGATAVLAAAEATPVVLELPDDLEAMNDPAAEASLEHSDAESWLLGEQSR